MIDCFCLFYDVPERSTRFFHNGVELDIIQVGAANLERSYRRAPKHARECKKYAGNPPGICHLCMCGTKEGNWEDLTLVFVHM